MQGNQTYAINLKMIYVMREMQELFRKIEERLGLALRGGSHEAWWK
jgi:hypothetical protein